MSTPSILPFDAPNRQQIAQGHPPDWRPPRPKDWYDLVVLGGGPAGLTAAVTAAKAGHPRPGAGAVNKARPVTKPPRPFVLVIE